MRQSRTLSHVCVVSTSFPRYVGDLAGHFVHREMSSLPTNIRFDVIVPGHPGSPAYQDLGNIKVHRFQYFWPEHWQRLAYGDGIPDNIRRSFVAKLNVPTFLVAMAAAVRKHCADADLIHAHWSVSCLAAVVAGRGCPIVVTPHGSDVYNRNPLLQKANRFALPRAAATIIYSEPYRPVLSKIGVAPERIHSVPHGLPAPSDADVAWCRAHAVRRAPQDTAQLVFVGRLVKVKAVDNLIEAVAELRREGLRLHLTLVGDGSERPALAQKVAEAGLNAVVDFVGTVPTHEVRRYLAGGDIFVLPSLSEGFSESLWEALSYGLPCVSTEVGIAGEIIEQGRNGFLVAPGSPTGLLEPLRLLVANPRRRAEMATAARESILRSPHSLGASAQAVLRVYEEAVSSGSRKKG